MLAHNQALFPIGTAVKLSETPRATLQRYEQANLVKPARKGTRRYYTMNEIKWIDCLRGMIEEQGISIAAVKKLLQYTPCWNIADCSFEKRKMCTAFLSNALLPRKIATGKGENHRCRIIPLHANKKHSNLTGEQHDCVNR